MKNFTTQILSATMLVMVYAASLPYDPLGQIKYEAQKLSENNTLNGKIPWPATNGAPTVLDFFCLTEEALRHSSLNGSHLYKLVRTYTKEFPPKIPCQLQLSHHITIQRFLNNIVDCAEKARHKLP